MKRHPFRWESLTFGAFYLAIVGNWAVWKADVLTPRELSVTASVVLIVFGLLGIVATVRPRSTPNAALMPEPEPSPTTPKGPENEETDSQS